MGDVAEHHEPLRPGHGVWTATASAIAGASLCVAHHNLALQRTARWIEVVVEATRGFLRECAGETPFARLELPW